MSSETLKSQVEKCSVQEAKEILGEYDVFGPEEWRVFFGDKFQVANIPEIPWSQDDLKYPTIKQEHFLFLGINVLDGEPLNMSTWNKLYKEDGGPDQPRLNAKDGDEFLKLRWYLIPVGGVEA